MDGYVLFWVDPQWSASIAADGMMLMAAPLKGGRARPLTTSLGYRQGVVPGPPGHVYVVAGPGREVWDQKRLVDCSLLGQQLPGGVRELRLRAVRSRVRSGSGQARLVLAKNQGLARGFLTDAGTFAWLRSHVLAVASADGRHLHLYPDAAGAYAPARADRGRVVVYLGLDSIDASVVADGRRIVLVHGLSLSWLLRSAAGECLLRLCAFASALKSQGAPREARPQPIPWRPWVPCLSSGERSVV